MSIEKFIPTIWSARLLAHLDNTLVANRFFNNDWEGEIREKGNTVKINQIGDVSVFDYIPNQDMDPPETLGGVQQEMVIDFAKAFNFQIDDVDNVQSNPKLMDAAMERSGVGLSAVVDAWLFDKLIDGAASSNVLSATITTPDELYVALTRLRTMLTVANIPIRGRLAAMPPSLVELTLQDDRFTKTGSSDAENRLQDGVVARAAGFDILEVNTIPGNSHIIAGHPISATAATQITKTEAYRMEKRFADGLKGLFLGGAQVTRPNGVALAQVTLATGASGAFAFSAAKLSEPDNKSTNESDDERPNEPGSESLDKEGFEAMTIAQLQEYAAENGIEIPPTAKSKAEILSAVKGNE